MHTFLVALSIAGLIGAVGMLVAFGYFALFTDRHPSEVIFTFPSRIELKACSNWTLWPWFCRTESTHKTKHFWLFHLPFLPFCDLWVHFEGPR